MSVELVTTGVGGGVIVMVLGYLAKHAPDWWKYRGERSVKKAEAAAASQEQAFDLLSKAAERIDRDVERLDRKSEGQARELALQSEQIKQLQGSNSTLAEENRSFRRLILGVVSRLELIAQWVRDGHQPPPPYTTEQLLAYIREASPPFHEEEP